MSVSSAPKRFYKDVEAVSAQSGWTIELDGRPVKTPAKAPLILPTQHLAEKIASEWADQGDTLNLDAMVLTKLTNVAVDRTPRTRDDLATELRNYAETDVTCYLADAPAALRQRQEEAWRPWRDWAGENLGIMLLPVEGLTAAPQPEASLEAVRNHALGLDDFRLTGLAWGCSLFGSAILALAVEQGALDGAGALRASCVDEDWQIEHWGEDEEAALARSVRLRDANAVHAWFEGLSI